MSILCTEANPLYPMVGTAPAVPGWKRRSQDPFIAGGEQDKVRDVVLNLGLRGPPPTANSSAVRGQDS